MSRAERVARMHRDVDAVRSCLRRLEGEVYSAGLKLDAIEADLKQLASLKPDLANDSEVLRTPRKTSGEQP